MVLKLIETKERRVSVDWPWVGPFQEMTGYILIT